MKKCTACGRENENGASYCSGCGLPLDRPGPGPAIEQPRKKSHVRAAVAVVIVIILVAVGGLWAFTAHSETVEITVQSDHVLQDVDVTVYVDGKQVSYEGGLGALESFTVTYEYRFPVWTSSEVIEVRAVSTGGGLGSQTDSEYVTATDGGTSAVELIV